MNGTQSDVNSVWRALNRTDGQLVRLSRGVWTEVNSTKDDLQRLRNATQNITDQVTTKFTVQAFGLIQGKSILGKHEFKQKSRDCLYLAILLQYFNFAHIRFSGVSTFFKGMFGFS